MSYKVKEIFFTLQGEGLNSGRPSVFCRFSGCNFWSGRPADRTKAICNFCDTDFNGTDGLGGGEFANSIDLARAIASAWPQPLDLPPIRGAARPLVVFTGGEPLLQLDNELVLAVKKLGFQTAVETNGSIVAPDAIDWITVSPKSLSHLIQRSGDELKLVYPQAIQPEELLSVPELNFRALVLSPLADPDPAITAKNTQLTLDYCRKNPQWRLSLQVHKIVNIP